MCVGMLTKLSLTIVFSLVAAAVTAFATPMCSDNVTGNGSVYFGGGYSCHIGDLLFSGFSYTPSGSNPIITSQITVDAVGPTGTGASTDFADIGLSFHAPWSAGPGQTSDATIDFTVTTLGTGTLISDLGLAQTSGISGNGTASVIEQGCAPAPCNATGGPYYVLTFQDGGGESAQGETYFAGQSSISVLKDIAVTGGSGNSFAGISVVQDTFSVPEPVSMGLMGGGLTLLGLARLRRRR